MEDRYVSGNDGVLLGLSQIKPENMSIQKFIEEQAGNTYPFRVCCGIYEKLGQTPNRIGETIPLSEE
jgi:hypothetical protein